MSAVPAEPVQNPEPAWRQRAVERSTRAAKLRAEQRVQRFLDAAQELLAAKGTTDFTVQEVVEHSRQSLRSFYQHFDGKHELLLALFEDALSKSATEIREKAASGRDPLDRLKIAVEVLFDSCKPRAGRESPLFTDFAVQLLISHPDQVAAAHLPLLGLFTELVEHAVEAGQVTSPKPRRTASLLMKTAMFTAQASAVPVGTHTSSITVEEVWGFCLGGITGGAAAGKPTDGRGPVAAPSAKKTAAAKRATSTTATRKAAPSTRSSTGGATSRGKA